MVNLLTNFARIC